MMKVPETNLDASSSEKQSILSEESRKPQGPKTACSDFSSFACEMMQSKNFVVYTANNFLMNANVYLTSSFFLLLDGILMTSVMPASFHFIVVAGCLYIPKIGVPLMTPLANRVGLASLIQSCILTIALSGFVALASGRAAIYIWGPMLVMQRFALSSWGFYDVVMADVIDEDRLVRGRPKSVATSIHGLQSLVVKPAQSLAQVVGLKLLMSNGLGNYQKLEAKVNGMSSQDPGESLKDSIFTLTFAAPVIISIVQFLIWRRFDLRGKRLSNIKSKLQILANTKC